MQTPKEEQVTQRACAAAALPIRVSRDRDPGLQPVDLRLVTVKVEVRCVVGQVGVDAVGPVLDRHELPFELVDLL